MSKYIAIIDLPDDSKCFKCPHWIGYGADGCELVKQTDNGNRPTRPTDCPLIPVDRVMDAIESHKEIASVGAWDCGWDAGIDQAMETLRGELGVTE